MGVPCSLLFCPFTGLGQRYGSEDFVMATCELVQEELTG